MGCTGCEWKECLGYLGQPGCYKGGYCLLLSLCLQVRVCLLREVELD